MERMASQFEKGTYLSFDEICTATAGTLLYNYAATATVCALAIDSRDCLPASLFIPLRGEKQDGHQYCEAALQNGARCFFIDEAFFRNTAQSTVEKLCAVYHAACILVKNTLYALQDCARYFVTKFPQLIKIAITGSSGKTTTKEILASILSAYQPTVFSEANFNSETGLPLSVFKIKRNAVYAVFEMGMNRKNEIAELARIVKPKLALITNIGTAHIGMLGSRENIAKEKKQIFSQFTDECTGFIPRDEWSEFLAAGVKGQVQCIDIKKTIGEKFTQRKSLGTAGYEFYYAGTKIHFALVGEHNLTNAVMAVCVAEFLKVPVQYIIEGLQNVHALYGRAEIVQGTKAQYLFDVYNANPQSMHSALSFLEDIHSAKRKIAVLGSMLELGDYSFDAHKKIIEEVEQSNIDFCFLYGDEFYKVFCKLNLHGTDVKKFCVFKTDEAKELAEKINAIVEAGDFILLKGSRSLELERFAKCLGGNIQ